MAKLTLNSRNLTTDSVRAALAELKALLFFGLRKTHLCMLIGKYLFIYSPSTSNLRVLLSANFPS